MRRRVFCITSRFVPDPFQHFLNSRLFTVHQYPGPVNFTCQPCGSKKKQNQKSRRQKKIRPWNTERYSCHHYNRGSKGNDREPVSNWTVRIIGNTEQDNYTKDKWEQNREDKLLCVGFIIYRCTNRCKKRGIQKISPQKIKKSTSFWSSTKVRSPGGSTSWRARYPRK